MSARWVLLGTGLLLVLLGGALGAATTPREDRGFVASLGQSLGGGRVIVEDVLFLRAEALRREGRVDEIPVLYDAVLRLDPTNTVAAEFLAGTYVYDVLPGAPDDDARFAWWTEAWKTSEGALQHAPDDPSLLVRSADLLLDVPTRHPELADRVGGVVGDAELLGLGRLLHAARRTDVLPRRGRSHLRILAQALPVLAGARLGAAPPGPEPILVIGEEVLALRGDTLARMTWDAPSPQTGETVSLPLDRVLARGLTLVREVGSDLEAGDRDRAKARIRAYDTEIPGSPLPALLEARLEGGD